MDYNLRWHAPFELMHSATLIYELIDQIADVPESPGVYVFARVHGKSVCPLYVGQSENLRSRIQQHLKTNVRLMRGIERAPIGARKIYVGELEFWRNAEVSKALKMIESALISTAMVEGHDLLNKHGTKTLAHTISSSGNREARRWLPDAVIKLRRAPN